MSRSMSVSTRSTSFSTNHAEHDNAALRAARTSHKLPVTPSKTLTKNGFVSNAAAMAASRAGTQGQILGVSMNNGVFEKVSYGPSHTPGRAPDTSIRHATGTSSQATRASPVRPETGARGHSPSHIAAMRASAYSASPSHAGRLNTRTSPTGRHMSPERKDETSIPATNKLVQMFEARSKTETDEARPLTANGPTVVLSPTPQRALSIRSTQHFQGGDMGGSAEVFRVVGSRPSSDQAQVKEENRLHNRTMTVGDDAKAQVQAISTFQTRQTKNVSQSTRDVPTPPDHNEHERSQQPFRPIAPSRSSSPPDRARTATMPPMRPSPRPLGSSQSITTNMLVPQDGHRASSRRRASHQSDKIQPQLTTDSLANAIVASSLASSRAASPHQIPKPRPQPPAPRRSNKPVAMSFLVAHSSGSSKHTSRHSSPSKGTILRPTLRKQVTGDAGEGKPRGRAGNKLKKHGGASALDSISLNDRKLYEGVWAANRGLLGPDSDPHPYTPLPPGLRPKAADEVHGLVVKDIWVRSGLELGLLERIWMLVDGTEDGVGKRSQRGWLGREEFVAGMWLIDQCLVGRKLPWKVPEEVWASLRVTAGLQFRR